MQIMISSDAHEMIVEFLASRFLSHGGRFTGLDFNI
jgi:hypothetical protein